MRILVANKFWYRRAGLERVMFDEIAWLQEAGHEVAHFSTQHPENDPSPWSDYFSPYLEIGVDTDLTTRQKSIAAVRMFWNDEAARCFARLLRDFRPDIVHVHGIHRQISPSILVEARRAGVPVVQSLHDYHPICAAGDLLLAGQRACDPPRCGSIDVLPCVVHGCVQHSRSKSALAAAELLSRRWLSRGPDLIDAFISPSRYLARVVRAGGLDRRPIHVLPNAVPRQEHTNNPDEGFFVYAGRLSREKGLLTLLRAVRLAGVPLMIAGDGPLRDALAADAPPEATLLGRLTGSAVEDLLRRCRAAVIPSEWAENAPMAVLEPMALGRPVIATQMGGIPEQARDGKEGILFAAGDSLALAAALRLLTDDESLAARFGAGGRRRTRTLFSPEQHTQGLLGVYASVLAGRRPPVWRMAEDADPFIREGLTV
jgi:glycosyltransferase involved in cell wall biosynthesis